MTKEKLDRRVQRTRALLNHALMSLVQEKGYDAITVEDITERANLGRTTFYLHYENKDDLLIDHHNTFVTQLNLNTVTREQLLGQAPQPEMVEFLERMSEGRRIYLAFTQGRDAALILHNIQKRMQDNLTRSLDEIFPDTVLTIPLDVLTRYIVNGEFAIIDWFVTNRTTYTAEQVADMLHQMRANAVRNAYGLG